MMEDMKKTLSALWLSALALAPAIAFAATSVQSFLGDTVLFINGKVVPFLFALAFLFFLWNAFRYFILGGDQEAEREKARKFALWGLIAFVLLVSIWGIVNLLVSGFGINNGGPVCPDYLPGLSGPGSDCLTPPIT
jgi:succinate dehydrogenase/fumarate reductase cytochrome b subunit